MPTAVTMLKRADLVWLPEAGPNPIDHPHLFRPVALYEGLYVVSADGDVWSVPKRRANRMVGYAKVAHVRRGKNSPKPYIQLNKRGKRKTFRVLDLVMIAFPEIFPDIMRRFGYV